MNSPSVVAPHTCTHAHLHIHRSSSSSSPSSSSSSRLLPRCLLHHPLFLFFTLLVFFISTITLASGSCHDCCNPSGSCSRAFHRQSGICCGVLHRRPFCCPSDATCVQKDASRYACRYNAAKTSTSSDAASGQPSNGGYDDDTSSSSSWCGSDCILGWAIAACLFLPCCCWCTYLIQRRRRQESQDAALWSLPSFFTQRREATAATAARPDVRDFTPPVVYGHGDPRVPHNTPEPPVRGAAGRETGGYGTAAMPQQYYYQQPPPPAIAATTATTATTVVGPAHPVVGGVWQGQPHKLSDDEDAALLSKEGQNPTTGYEHQQYQQQQPFVYPHVAHSPPPLLPTAAPTTTSDDPTAAMRAGEHQMAEPIEVKRQHEQQHPAGGTAATEIHAPGGATITPGSVPLSDAPPSYEETQQMGSREHHLTRHDQPKDYF